MHSEYKKHREKLKILLLGYIIRGPIGGMTWHHLQYFLGLHQMGHEVYFLEDSGDSEYSCYNPITNETTSNPEYGLQYAKSIFNSVGLGNSWGFYNSFSQTWEGPLKNSINKVISGAEVLINLSCSNLLRDWSEHVPARILIDTDPVFTQIRNLTDEARFNLSSRHNIFYTFGEKYCQDDCLTPRDHFPWKPTRQPIILSEWPHIQVPVSGKLTTVLQWDSYQTRVYKEIEYGMKSASFLDYLKLPHLAVTEKFLLALGIKKAQIAQLENSGWEITDPLEVTKSPWTYQHFIQQSKAEWSVAKHGYVIANCGWFSERSAAYLASGKPVIMQETGFSSILPTGDGLFSFKNVETAVEAIEKMNSNYTYHCRKAREIAHSYFNSDKILNEILQHL